MEKATKMTNEIKALYVLSAAFIFLGLIMLRQNQIIGGLAAVILGAALAGTVYLKKDLISNAIKQLKS